MVLKIMNLFYFTSIVAYYLMEPQTEIPLRLHNILLVHSTISFFKRKLTEVRRFFLIVCDMAFHYRYFKRVFIC